VVVAHFPLDLSVETTLREAMGGNSPVLPLEHSIEHVVLVAMLKSGM
jgi:hypothetical protein